MLEKTWILRSRFLLSRCSRRNRDLYLLYLVLWNEIKNLFYQISNFEKGTRNKKEFLVAEREFSLLNLTRFFEIEKSRHALMWVNYIYAMWRWKKQYTCSKKNMNNNLVFFSRQDQDFYYLVVRDKIENLFRQISNFEKRTRNKKRISRGRARILVAII